MSVNMTTIVEYITTTAASVINNGGAGNQVDSGGSKDGSHMDMQPKENDMMAQMLSTAQKMHYATSVVVGPIFVILGTIGNILSIVVWTRRHMKSSTGRYLTALAVADLGVLVFFILSDTVKMIYPDLENSPGYSFIFAYLAYPFFFFSIVCSIWFMVGVTVDRFIMVCLITKAKEYCNETRANVGIGLISGLCFLINMPHFWSYEVDWDRDANSTGPALLKTEFQKGEGGIRYEFWIHCIFLVLVPWFSVFTLNLLIISKIGKANRKMSSKKTAQAADKSRHSENQITRLLLIVTFTFLFLLGCQCITQCFYMIMPDGFDKNIIDEAFAVAKLGVIINSSINFFLYCLSGRRFRQELLILLGCKRRALNYLSTSDHSSSTGTTGTTGTSNSGV
ncbi:hypothetical protein ACOMHN_018351 [Nucella lapillus]